MFRNKLKLLTGIIAIGLSTTVFSQVKEKQPIDTTITEDVKESTLENIPVVSLDDNDAQDGSAQNISGQISAGRNMPRLFLPYTGIRKKSVPPTLSQRTKLR